MQGGHRQHRKMLNFADRGDSNQRRTHFLRKTLYLASRKIVEHCSIWATSLLNLSGTHVSVKSHGAYKSRHHSPSVGRCRQRCRGIGFHFCHVLSDDGKGHGVIFSYTGLFTPFEKARYRSAISALKASFSLLDNSSYAANKLSTRLLCN